MGRIIELKSPQEGYVDEVVEVLKKGGVAILPTETVYGLACSFYHKKARQRLYNLKKRPPHKPFALGLYDSFLVESFIFPLPLSFYKISESFLPGPLTLVLNKDDSSWGFRVPQEEFTLKVLERFRDPVFLTSANLSGNNPAVNIGEALKDITLEDVDIAVDNGPTRYKRPSTVVLLEDQGFNVLRRGVIPAEEIAKALEMKNILFVCTGNSCRSVMAQALMEKYLGQLRPDLQGKVKVDSCGISSFSGAPASQTTLKLLNEEGIDYSVHYAKECSASLIKKQDLILVATTDHRDYLLSQYPYLAGRVYLLLKYVGLNERQGEIPDPIGKSEDFYREVFSLIKEAILRLVKML